MTDPRTPHVMGITLDSTGVANTKVAALNRSNGNRQIVATDANKRAVFDASAFTDGYTNGDVIEFENTGASHGGTTITINTTSGFQEATITCAAAPTGQIRL